jgi:hypothetical protein
MDAEIKREFDRLHRELKALTAMQKKETWVPYSWVIDVTGWTNNRLQQAREQGIIASKKSDKGGYLYKLESIPEQFIIKKQAI